MTRASKRKLPKRNLATQEKNDATQNTVSQMNGDDPDAAKKAVIKPNALEESISKPKTVEVFISKPNAQPFRLQIQIEKLPLKPNLAAQEKTPVKKDSRAKRRKTKKTPANDSVDKNDGEIKHTCLVCTKGFSVLSEFYEHSKEHFTCDICEMEFMSQKSYLKHCKIHRSQNDKQPFQCHVCSTLFKTKEEIKKHDHIFLDKYDNENALDDRIHYCASCNISFDDEITFRKHLDSHVETVGLSQLNKSTTNEEECMDDH